MTGRDTAPATVVLRSPEGACYAVPPAALVAYRLADEQAARLAPLFEEWADDDAAGFSAAEEGPARGADAWQVRFAFVQPLPRRRRRPGGRAPRNAMEHARRHEMSGEPSVGQEQEAVLAIPASDGYYAIPLSVVEVGRIPEERHAELARLLQQGDVRGFSGGVVLPYSSGDACYALPAEVVAAYKVSAEREAEIASSLEAAEGDTRGFGPCPPDAVYSEAVAAWSAFLGGGNGNGCIHVGMAAGPASYSVGKAPTTFTGVGHPLSLPKIGGI